MDGGIGIGDEEPGTRRALGGAVVHRMLKSGVGFRLEEKVLIPIPWKEVGRKGSPTPGSLQPPLPWPTPPLSWLQAAEFCVVETEAQTEAGDPSLAPGMAPAGS